MFNFVRNNKRLSQVVLGLIALPFAFFGVQSYERMFNSTPEVAEVGGSKITEQEFSRVLREQQDRLRGALRGIDPALLDTPEMRAEMLDNLITRRLLALYSARNNLMASDEQLRDLIASLPAFQENGRFSPSTYGAMLRAQGLTEQSFEGNLRQDLATQQLLAGVGESGFAPSSVARLLALMRGEQREVAEALLVPEQFTAQVKPTPEAIQAYYDTNRARFQVPEQVRAEYVVLSGEVLAAKETVSAEEVRKWYDDNMGAKFAERAVAKKKAEEVLAQLQKSPGRFAELAKQVSQDPGSKDNGGDLGFFGRGMMLKPFEDAVYKLKPGQLSGLVESDFGFHIIKLTAVRPAGKGEQGEQRQASHILINAPQVKDFQASRAEIESDLKKQRAAKKFSEAAETFSNTAYEQPDSLKPVAEKFGLQVQSGGWITRQGQPGPGPLGNARLLAALFSDDALKNKRNTEAVEIAPGTLAAARVAEFKPAIVRPLAEVRELVVKQITLQETAGLAQKAGAEKLTALRKGESAGVNWGAPKLVSRDNPQGLKPEALAQVFSADAASTPAYAGVVLPGAGYALYRISRVVALDKLDAEKEKASREQLQRVMSAQEFQAFTAGLRERTKVEINKAALEKKDTN